MTAHQRLRITRRYGVHGLVALGTPLCAQMIAAVGHCVLGVPFLVKGTVRVVLPAPPPALQGFLVGGGRT